MGCDIHAYIEFGEDMTDVTRIECFGKVRIPRNYLLFALLAGVRSDGTVEPVVPPRGIPKPLSFCVAGKYTEFVKPKERPKLLQDNTVRWWDPDKLYRVCPDWHTPSWLTADELRLVRKEFLAAQSALDTDDGLPAEYDLLITNVGVVRGTRLGTRPWPVHMDAVIAAMDVLPNARLVFWFDN